jgi:hypothetical protein
MHLKSRSWRRRERQLGAGLGENRTGAPASNLPCGTRRGAGSTAGRARDRERPRAWSGPAKRVGSTGTILLRQRQRSVRLARRSAFCGRSWSSGSRASPPDMALQCPTMTQDGHEPARANEKCQTRVYGHGSGFQSVPGREARVLAPEPAAVLHSALRLLRYRQKARRRKQLEGGSGSRSVPC